MSAPTGTSSHTCLRAVWGRILVSSDGGGPAKEAFFFWGMTVVEGGAGRTRSSSPLCAVRGGTSRGVNAGAEIHGEHRELIR